MEYRIGQIFEMDGIWYQFVRDNSNGCNSCVFHTMGCKCVHPQEGVRCGSWERRDETDGHFVRLLPLDGEYEQGGDKWQRYKCIEKPNTEDKRVYIAHTDSEVGLIVSIRLTSLTDMKNEMAEIKNENLSNTENIGKKLKPFDIQKAREGKPVCTRDGRNVRIIAFDAKRKDEKNIIALVPSKDYPGFEDLIAYPNNGNYYGGHENDGDLMMLPEKKEGWVNVSKFSIYASKEEALSHKTYDIISTVKVEWYE